MKVDTYLELSAGTVTFISCRGRHTIRQDGVEGKRYGERPNDLKEMVSVFDLRGEVFDNGLEVRVDVSRGTFSGKGEGGDNGGPVL